jgi:hypothetical protein
MSDVSQGPGWWQSSDGKWYPPQGAAPGGAVGPAKTSALAVTSLVTGILSLVACPIFGIVGLITGFMAKRKIQESNGEETGEGIATAGIITSALGVVLIGGILILILAVTFLGTAASSKFSSVGTAIPN